MADDQDQKCLMFVETTGAELEPAKKFLEASGWNVENALNLYFTDPNMFNQAAAAPPPLRAPINARFSTLAGPQQNPMFQTGANATEPFRNYAQEWTRGTRQDERGLADLFAPPDYVFKGTLEEACISGMENGKWLLVNIQTNEEFASHVLNRDIWKPHPRKNQVLVPLVKDKFLFCQRDHRSVFGLQFVNTYNITKLPCVVILNPITRALVLNIPLKNIPELNDVMGPIIQFIESNPRPEIPGSHNEPTQPERKQSDVSMTSEDAEMARAIAASLQTKDPMQAEEAAEEEVAPEPSPPKPVQNIYPAPKPEPGKDAKSTGLRITLPNGKKISRRFLKSDNVSEIYAVIEHEHDDQYNDISKHVLILPFPKVVLGVDTLNKTLQELSLLRVSLTMSEI